MDNNSLKFAEQKVLEVYTKVNPSYRPIEDDKELYLKILKSREQLFFRHLKLPKKLFQNSNLLSLGCGTGEYEAIYAQWGAKLSCVEMNPISVSRTKKLFEAFNITDQLEQISCISYFDFESDQTYDMVVTDGSVVHTDDPIGAITKFTRYVDSEGFLIFSFAELSGMFQRNIQRYILYCLSDGDESKIVEYSKLLFKEHLDRSVAIGKRTEKSIIYDTYVNPKIKTPSLLDIFGIMDEIGFELYSMYPMGEPVGFCESFREINESLSSPKNIHMFLLSQINWLLAADTNNYLAGTTFESWIPIMNEYENFIKHFYDISMENSNLEILNKGITSLENITKFDITSTMNTFYNGRLESLLNDLKNIQLSLENKDIQQLAQIDYDVIFKGCCGVGTNYFVFQHKLF